MSLVITLKSGQRCKEAYQEGLLEKEVMPCAFIDKKHVERTFCTFFCLCTKDIVCLQIKERRRKFQELFYCVQDKLVSEEA